VLHAAVARRKSSRRQFFGIRAGDPKRTAVKRDGEPHKSVHGGKPEQRKAASRRVYDRGDWDEPGINVAYRMRL
jgi:hypothetical protein